MTCRVTVDRSGYGSDDRSDPASVLDPANHNMDIMLTDPQERGVIARISPRRPVRNRLYSSVIDFYRKIFNRT